MIAACLIMRENDKDAYFYEGAEGLIMKLIVFICTDYRLGDRRRNIIELRELLTMDKELLLVMLKTACSSGKVHPEVSKFYDWLNEIVRTKNKGAYDVFQFTQHATSFLMSSQVQDSLKTSNIDILSIKNNPMSLYLILDMDKLSQGGNYYKSLIRLIVTVCKMGVSTDGQPKDKILFMLDEIAQLGTLQYLPDLLTIYRSKGVVVWTIWQSLAQIKERYEKSWETILGNCDVQQYFGINHPETAKYVSELAGETTVYEESETTSETESSSETETEARGGQDTRIISITEGDTSGYSYQGFHYTRSGSHSSSVTTSNNYTDSYNFSRAIQRGSSETKGKTLTKKTVPLITPTDVRTGMSVQFVFYMKKCPYPILSGKIIYHEDKEFYGEYSENLTRM
jgi:type IV secretion system protein VirD4